MEEAETICELSIRISPSIKQIQALAKLLTIHPNGEYLKFLPDSMHFIRNFDFILVLIFLVTCFFAFSDENNEILYGSEFLGYLYRQIIDVTQQEISIMLILILSDCCDVYFR